MVLFRGLPSMATLNDGVARLLRVLGIDKPVFFAFAGKAWSMAAGLVTSLLIASYFSPELQGYYYTFFAVLSLQVFAELGLGTVISTHASHEWSRLGFDKNGEVTGDAESLSRLISLGNFALKWYLAASIVATLALIVGGCAFFGLSDWSQMSAWGWAWLFLCVVSGANLCCMPVWALLEGCNQLTTVYRSRLIQAVASSATGWAAIFLGADLWVCALMGLASLVVSGLTVIRRYKSFLKLILLGVPAGARLNWKVDLLPMQWRISLSWMSGYFIFSLFTPVLFHFQGAVVAGQMGMTWMFVSALTAIGSAWVAPKAPMFGMLAAQRKYQELDEMLRKLTITVAGISMVAAFLIWSGIFILNKLDNPYAYRLLSPGAAACLLAATVIQLISLPTATCLRSHRKEPLFALSVATAGINAIVVIMAARYSSAQGVAIGYLLVVGGVTPFVWVIWRRCIREWR